MRDDGLYLEDIVEAADHVAEFLDGVTREDFDTSEMIRSAVLLKLQVIGEAAAHVSAEVRDRYPEVPWTQVVAFRNFAVHAYFALDWSLVWRAATHSAPILRGQVAQMLAKDFPDTETDD